MQTSPAAKIARPAGLDAIFAPKNVAVIGATERPGSVGRQILWNLIQTSFGGTVFPVNPTRPSVLGIRAYPSIKDVPDQVDLAVIVTPANGVPKLVQDCADVGVRGLIIISAGFKERGPEGVKLETEIMAIARQHNIRIIGPNCLGVMSPLTGLNATFASAMARPGNVGFISQSGALCTAVLDWSFRENVGFSAFVSIGSMLDVGWGDLIDYLGNDQRTSSIVIYMESVGDARSFLSAAREVALRKPIIIIKAGRTDAAAQAAASHTGSLTGSDEVLDAAFRRSGVLRVDRISDVFYMAEVLGKQPRPKGNRLTIITNAGGPGVLATDALIGGGGELSTISPATMEALNGILPAYWSHNNPIDVLGDASPDLYAKTLEIAGNDPNSDGLLVILTPQGMSEPTQTADALRSFGTGLDKPVLASWMGGPQVASGQAILNQANIPTFEFPDTAARTFNYMWQYATTLQALYETPILPADSAEETPDRAAVEAIIQKARSEGRPILTEYESKQVLAAYLIPTVGTRVCTTEDDAVRTAAEFGYPVVLKLHSETITHKTDVGGVQLNLRDEAAVRSAYSLIRTSVAEKAGEGHFDGVAVQPMVKLDGYELIIGSSVDPQFGPVLLFGTGGQLVEVFKDRSLSLPPLNTTLARRMMETTKIYTALQGVRGREAVDLAALERLLVRFSQLVVEQPWIKEIDINPLLINQERMIALDARVVIYGPEMTEDVLPRAAIRPYPSQYGQAWTSRDGTPVTFRPIRPEDEPLMASFHETLSERTVFQRYLQAMNLSQRIGHDRLSRLCFIDYDREIALVAVRNNPKTGKSELLGISRITKDRQGTIQQGGAEFTLLVSDRFQHQGLGKELLNQIIAVARAEKVTHLHGQFLQDNAEMVALVSKLGFAIIPGDRDNIVNATLTL